MILLNHGGPVVRTWQCAPKARITRCYGRDEGLPQSSDNLLRPVLGVKGDQNNGSSCKARYKTLQVDKLVTGEGRRLPPRLAQEVAREIERLALVQQQIKAAEEERDKAETCQKTEKKRLQLLALKGIGLTGSAVLAREVYYRQFGNRQQVAGFLGLATSPYASGELERCQGIDFTTLEDTNTDTEERMSSCTPVVRHAPCPPVMGTDAAASM